MATTRPYLDFPRNEAGLVDNFIGTAYDVVKGVYDNLDTIKDVHEVVEEIPELAQKSVDDALEKALPPALEAIQGSVDEAKEAADAAAQSAVEASKVSLMYPFTYKTSTTVYDVTVISGRADVTTAGLALWIEGAIEYNFTILSTTQFALNDSTDYADDAQMRIIVNARFDDLVKNFDELQKTIENSFMEFLEKSGLEVPVLYAPGILISRPTQTVTYQGRDYRVNHTYLPAVTTTWEQDSYKMILVSESTIRYELADNGASMVGFIDPVAPAYLKTVSDLLNAERVSIMRFVDRTDHRALYDGMSRKDYTNNLQEAFNNMRSGGELTMPPITLNHTGLEILPSRNFKFTGYGWKSKLKNNSSIGAHDIWVRGETAEDRSYGLDLSSFTLEGNPLSGDGLRLDRLGWYDVNSREASVTNLDKIQVINSGQNGIQVGRSSNEGAGNSVNLIGSVIRKAGRTGLLGIGQTNMISIQGCNITLCGQDGVEFNQVSSTNLITQNLIADNKRYGVYAFRCEQPMVTHNGFNRNGEGSVAFSGDPDGSKSVKYTEAGLIFANLFGDNGGKSATQREVSIFASKGINILANYFYGTKQKTMIYLSNHAEGITIKGNHFKDLTTEVMLELIPNAVKTTYTFDDDVDESTIRNIISNKAIQKILAQGTTLLQIRNALTDAAPRFTVGSEGNMNWGSGVAPVDVGLSRAVAGSLRCSGGLQAQRLMLADSISLPNAAVGYASLFIDAADGLFKIRYANGIVRTITVT